MTAPPLAQLRLSEPLAVDAAPSVPHLAVASAAPVSPAPEPAKARTGSEARQRRHVVGVRLDDTERAALEARAGDTGLSLGAYLRACSLETAGPRARRRAPVDRELLARTNAELNRVGNNLNQIAKAGHIGQDAVLDDVTRTAGELRQALVMLRRALGYDSQG